MRKNIHKKQRFAAGLAALSGAVGLTTAFAADVTYDFTSDPSSVLTISTGDSPWVSAGGNPGGFLAITYPVGGYYSAVAFPNADPGKVVTGFTFTADLRVGNSSGDRAADGFSVSFARAGDLALEPGGLDSQGWAAVSGAAEMGTRTGIAVSFDTWSGNTLPDGADIEGIIVRVDNVTVNRTGLPTRHGACTDNTSMQTGPRDAAFFAGGGDPKTPESWAGLCWQPFKIDLTSDGKLTVEWKNRKVLDSYQTTYFPSAGQLVLGGRTGGADEHTHFDNIHLVTVASTVTAVPTAPGSLTAAETGSRRVKLTWAASTLPGDPNGKVAYEVERDGVVLSSLVTTLSYDDRGVAPGTSHVYKVRGKNVAGTAGADATINVTTAQDADGVGFPQAAQWTGLNGNTVDDMNTAIADAATRPADRVRYVNGMSFGETSNFGDTWGENHLVRINAIFTSPKAGEARFFVRSDDASALYVKAGTTYPDPVAETAVAIESGCCGGFEDVGADGTLPEVTSEKITLTAGGKYALSYFVKEGGGGDWGQVAIRFEGDTTPAANLTPLRGAVLTSKVDAVGASVTLTSSPADQTVVANSSVTFTAAATGTSPYAADYGSVIAYQWFRAGVPILGANSATYTIPVVPVSDNGVKYGVAAGVAGAATAVSEFTLTVNVDNVAPTVTRVGGSAKFNSITVAFSEPVGDATALDASKYAVTGLTLSAPVRVNDRTVTLTTSTQTEGTTYNITVNGVKDLGGNSSAYTGTFRAYQFKTGLATFNTWDSTIPFDQFADIRDTTPTTTGVVTQFHSPINIKNNFFGQVSGWFVPETTGSYVFLGASDDTGALYLSTDASPANKKQIAFEPSWGGAYSWTGAGNGRDPNADGLFLNRSDTYPATEWPSGNTITLTAGQRYYIEYVYREGGGGDNGGATFKLAGAADPANGTTSAITGGRIGTLVDPGTLPPIITKRPVGAKAAPGAMVMLSVEVDSAIPVTYQWFQNKKAIAGATSATYHIDALSVGNIGDYYVDVTSANGTASSFPDNDVRVEMTGVGLVVEAEDFNYGNGQTVAAASVSPLASDLYKGLDGVEPVDLVHSRSQADSGIDGNSLRQGWKDGDVVHEAAEGANVDVISDGNPERPDFTLTQNYKIGWGEAGDWYNYTRDFAPGTYSVVVGFSQDGRSADATTLALDIVTGDVTKGDTQVATRVAQATVSQTGGWSSNDNVPLWNVDGTGVAEFTLGAKSTVRLNIVKGGPDLDYLLFYKKGTVTPTVTAEAGGIPGITGGVSNVSVNTATKTITATTTGDAGFIKVTGATKIKSVTLVGTTLTVVYE